MGGGAGNILELANRKPKGFRHRVRRYRKLDCGTNRRREKSRSLKPLFYGDDIDFCGDNDKDLRNDDDCGNDDGDDDDVGACVEC